MPAVLSLNAYRLLVDSTVIAHDLLHHPGGDEWVVPRVHEENREVPNPVHHVGGAAPAVEVFPRTESEDSRLETVVYRSDVSGTVEL